MMILEVFHVYLNKFEIAVTHLFPILSYDVASGSEITPCNKICKPLVVYRFSENVMTSITTLRHNDKIITFYGRNEILSYDK